jgi:hypothetical protein
MSKVRQPHHDHTCLICRGKYPCWDLRCVLTGDFVCDDCAQEKTDDAAIGRNSQAVN